MSAHIIFKRLQEIEKERERVIQNERKRERRKASARERERGRDPDQYANERFRGFNLDERARELALVHELAFVATVDVVCMRASFVLS